MTGVSSVSADPGDETTYYFLTDHLGSVETVLDENGEVVERRDFLPYGSQRSLILHGQPHGADTVETRDYTGQKKDPETNLHYYNARYYDADIGRFTSLDPWEGDLTNPQTLNKYAYTINNPLKYTDPTGAVVEVVGRPVDFDLFSLGENAMHTFLRIAPDNPQDFGVDHEFSFTLSGQINQGNFDLVGEYNNPSDRNDNFTPFFVHEIDSTDYNMSDTELIQKIVSINETYDPDVYGLFSVFGDNCNDYSTSLLRTSGVDLDYESITTDEAYTFGWGDGFNRMSNVEVGAEAAHFQSDVIRNEQMKDGTIWSSKP